MAVWFRSIWVDPRLDPWTASLIWEVRLTLPRTGDQPPWAFANRVLDPLHLGRVSTLR